MPGSVAGGGVVLELGLQPLEHGMRELKEALIGAAAGAE